MGWLRGFTILTSVSCQRLLVLLLESTGPQAEVLLDAFKIHGGIGAVLGELVQQGHTCWQNAYV